MQAAIAAGKRGHDVTLWEKNNKLGGELLAAVCPPGKGEFASYIIALTKELAKLDNVKVELDKEADAESVKEFNADKVILATGGLANQPKFLGNRDNVIPAREILLGHRQVEGRILVAGGGEVGIETAMYLAGGERGEITVVEMAHKMAEKTDQTRYIPIRRFLLDTEVKLMNDTKVLEVTDTEMIVDAGGETKKLPYDAIVVAMGYHPNSALAEQLSFLGEKLAVIGDARQCQNAMEAASEGFEAGYNA
ncbi:MAG: FAD-dependent oxidoreductase [Solobacterium sp.]|nr:FAD-dependent oxidoreductase [Solobacterium sp.]